MNIERVHRLLKEKESIHLEFKEANNELPENLFETICSMLNRNGGDVFLGVTDEGRVQGIADNKAEKMVKDLVNLSNNQQKLNPPHILFPTTHIVDGKRLIHIEVPSSTQVHKTGKSFFDRSNDGDFKIEHAHQIAGLFNKKNKYYSERTIYPALRFEDFNQALFEKVRNLIGSKQHDHPWLDLSNPGLLEVAGLWGKDGTSGEEGYTLAAALLFGKDIVIQNILPYHKIDALVRIENFNRYDDRAYIQTNLIDTYEQLMNFVSKHLPDPFYMEGDQRVSIRTKIFREIASNLIIHREYMNPSPSIFTIFNDRVEVQNANNPNGDGPINPNNFSPFTKNPILAKFFKQIGRVDELGSGVLNTTRLLKIYTGNVDPVFIEGPVFRTIIPLKRARKMLFDNNVAVNDTVSDTVSDIVSDIVSDTVSNIVNDTVNSIIASAVRKNLIQNLSDPIKSYIGKIVLALYKQGGLKRPGLGEILGKSNPTIHRYLKIAQILSIIEYRGSDKTGGYFLTKLMKETIDDSVVRLTRSKGD